MKLTKELLNVNIKTYWLDFTLSSIAFIICFIIAHFLHSTIVLLISSIFLYRAGAFTHEICHQYKNPKIQTFKKVWTWTLGFIMLQPPLRFAKPHLAHHTTGIFSTEEDPQYPLLFSNWKFTAGIFLLLPWALPIYNLLVCLDVPIEELLYDKVEFSAGEKHHIKRIEVRSI